MNAPLFRLALGLFLAGVSALGAAEAVRFDPRAPAKAAAPDFKQVVRSKRAPADLLKPPSDPYTVGAGDKLEVEILGQPGSKQVLLAGPDGRIYYDLLSSTDVLGLTLAEVRDLLEQRLRDFYREPQVAVSVVSARSKRVWVLGRVNKPGNYPLLRPTTIIDAISQAGGLFTSRFSGTTEELADLEHSFVMRGGRVLPVNFHRLLREGDMSQNIYVRPDDFLYLPSALSQEIYVLGAVRAPRAVGFTQDLSLVAAITTAFGPLPGADLRHVCIVRGSLTDPRIAVVDFHEITQGRATNIRLEPRDIVYVPIRRWNTLLAVADLIVNTFVRTVAANEGNRAGAANAQPVGVNINIGR